MFKDYLLSDETADYLRKFFILQKTLKMLPQILNYYHEYQKVFPNYYTMDDGSIMFKNIKRKQKLIYDMNITP